MPNYVRVAASQVRGRRPGKMTEEESDLPDLPVDQNVLEIEGGLKHVPKGPKVQVHMSLPGLPSVPSAPNYNGLSRMWHRVPNRETSKNDHDPATTAAATTWRAVVCPFSPRCFRNMKKQKNGSGSSAFRDSE